MGVSTVGVRRGSSGGILRFLVGFRRRACSSGCFPLPFPPRLRPGLQTVPLLPILCDGLLELGVLVVLFPGAGIAPPQDLFQIRDSLGQRIVRLASSPSLPARAATSRVLGTHQRTVPSDDVEAAYALSHGGAGGLAGHLEHVQPPGQRVGQVFQRLVLERQFLHGLAVDLGLEAGTAVVAREATRWAPGGRGENGALRVDKVVLADVGERARLPRVGVVAQHTALFAFGAVHYLGVGDCPSGGGDDVEGLARVVGGWRAGDGAQGSTGYELRIVHGRSSRGGTGWRLGRSLCHRGCVVGGGLGGRSRRGRREWETGKGQRRTEFGYQRFECRVELLEGGVGGMLVDFFFGSVCGFWLYRWRPRRA